MVRLTDRPDMTLDVYRGRKTTTQQQQQLQILQQATSYQCLCNIMLTDGCNDTDQLIVVFEMRICAGWKYLKKI